MFEHTSRYDDIETAEHKTSKGQTITYVRRRFLPQGERQSLLVEVTVAEDDRLDLITARTIGDPELFWCLCDANNAMNPFDLVAEPGVTLRVAVPEVGT
jgi:hypothetical protein